MTQWKLDDRKSIDIYGIHIVQSWYDLFFINCLLQYEKPRFQVIIELGSGIGSSTLFLALNSHGVPVHTFDKRPESKHPMYMKIKSITDITHYQRDIFDEGVKKLIKNLMDKNKTLLFCDDGDKTREFNTYASYLRKGDVIMAHDARVEIKMKDIIDTAYMNGLTPYHQDKSDEFGSRIFCFKKTL